MAATPQFADTPIIAAGQVSTANTGRDGTGTMSTLVSGATNGTRIDRITVEATVTTTAGMVRFFIHDGTNTRLWREVPVVAVTPSASAAAFTAILNGLGLVLPSTYELRASTHNAEAINVIVEGAEY